MASESSAHQPPISIIYNINNILLIKQRCHSNSPARKWQMPLLLRIIRLLKNANPDYMTLEEFWPLCLGHLNRTLPAAQYRNWIAPLGMGAGDGEWVIYAPSHFAANMVRRTYLPQIAGFLAEQIPQQTPRLAVRQGSGTIFRPPESKPLPEPQPESPPPAATKKAAGRQTAGKKTDPLASPRDIFARHIKPAAPTATGEAQSAPPKTPRGHTGQTASPPPPATTANGTGLKEDFTFATLVEGKGNQIAVAAGQAIAEAPGNSQYNPFFLYGNTGLGKTHLVQAIANRLRQLDPAAKVCYLHANEYIRSMMRAFNKKEYDSFKQHYTQYDLLILDDIQFLANKERTEEEFFHLFNHFYEKQKQIILTCDVLPNDIDKLGDRLKSRLNCGLALKLDPPELEMRVHILQKKAILTGVELNDETAFFIAQHIHSNVRDLEGAFNRVLARSKFDKRPIDIELAAKALHDSIVSQHKPITVDFIIETVAKYYGIRENDLTGKRRVKNILQPRQLAIRLSKELTTLSLSAIGEKFGNRDHSTVINAVEKAVQLCESQPETRSDYDKLLTLIKT